MLHHEDRHPFFTNYSTVSTNVYCTIKIQEILNLTIFVPFSLLQ